MTTYMKCKLNREESKSKYQKQGRGGWDDPMLAIPRKRMRIAIKRREKTCAKMPVLCTKWWRLLPPDLKW